LQLESNKRDRAVDAWLEKHLDGLVDLYEHLHANPELSLEEEKSAARMAKELRAAGYRVTTAVGGHGVVGVLENGPGQTVLIRGDMDGLPVREETGVPYASKVEVTREDGTRTGVMHACGHDVHMTGLVGTARLLAQTRSLWTGTIVAIAQPAEELGRGALAMMDDGLFERFPRPDYTIALHVESGVRRGAR
jgi:hippurate hydrolase